MVCSGPECGLTFERAAFESSSLLVLVGAKATLKQLKFDACPASGECVALFVLGVYRGRARRPLRSKVHVDGGFIRGYVQGMSVRAGAELYAKDMSIRADSEGVGVQGRGSLLELSWSYVIGGLAPVRSRAHSHRGVCFSGCAGGILKGCRFADGRLGLGVAEGADVYAERCSFSGNRGVAEQSIAAHVVGAELKLSDCNSQEDDIGFMAVGKHCQLRAKRTCVTRNRNIAGFCAFAGAAMKLQSCKTRQPAHWSVTATGALPRHPQPRSKKPPWVPPGRFGSSMRKDVVIDKKCDFGGHAMFLWRRELHRLLVGEVGELGRV